MAIYKKTSTDLEMYSGDTGNIKISKLPKDKNYHVHLDVIRAETQELIFTLMEESHNEDSVTFKIDEHNSNLLTVTEVDVPEVFYWSVKLCDPNTGMEDTVIPKTILNKETGVATFSKPYKLIVRYKMAKGCGEDVQ